MGITGNNLFAFFNNMEQLELFDFCNKGHELHALHLSIELKMLILLF